MTSTYHEGELEVQSRAGVREAAVRLGRGIHRTIPSAAQEFLGYQRFAIAGSIDASGHVWASMLTGSPGFMEASDEQTVKICAVPTPGDPLEKNIHIGAEIGLLAIEFATRRRMRLNGKVAAFDRGDIYIRTEQVFSNCPKYIQAREVEENVQDDRRELSTHSSTAFSEQQRRWIEASDTFFIASYHKEGGADVSHRGGNPGFIQIIDDRHFVWPDYQGNNMFQTLGNITANPQAGLLFLDFERGSTLQLTGQACVDWDEGSAAEASGTGRRVRFEVERVIEIAGAFHLNWKFQGYSPFNP